MSRHTAGPWVHHPDDNIISTHDRRKLLEWQARSQFVSTGERDANARLIAAAPELLEALISLLESFEAMERGEVYKKLAVKDARAAIKKATGGTT